MRLCAAAPSGLASTDDLAEAEVWDRIWPVTGRSTRAPMLSVVVTDDDLKHNRLRVYKRAHGHPTRGSQWGAFPVRMTKSLPSSRE